MAAQRDARGRFVKGNRAAKKRPTPTREFKEKAQAYAEEALLKLVDIMRSKTAQNPDIIRAAVTIIERAYGKPQQPEEEMSREISVVIEGAGKGLDE